MLVMRSYYKYMAYIASEFPYSSPDFIYHRNLLFKTGELQNTF